MVNIEENIFLNMILTTNIEIIFINNQDQFMIQSNKIRNSIDYYDCELCLMYYIQYLSIMFRKVQFLTTFNTSLYFRMARYIFYN